LYLPGAGWKGFDPTSGTLAADLHVRTAVTRDPVQAIPVTGSFEGASADFVRMEVTVNARAIPAATG
jgi:transglutaminase-like putative cysteine protease